MTLRRVLAVVIAFGLITAYPTSPAFAEDKEIWLDPDPRAGSNSAAEIMALQRPLVEAGEAILRLDPERQGLGGIRLRVRDRAMDIYWKGERPGELYDQVAKLEEQGYRGFLMESRYNGYELARFQEEIVTARDAYPGLATVSPLVDGSGLRVGFYKEGRPLKKFPVPVQVVPEDEMFFIDRGNDTSPFWGGGVARLVDPVFGGVQFCSTGFAVWRRNWFTTTEGMLTARHCDRIGGSTVTNGTGTRTLGVAEIPSPAAASHNSDSLFIPTNSHPRMFDGNVVGAFTKPVVGRVNNFVGQLVCTSGAATGVHCDIITDQISTTALIRVSPTDFERVDMLVMGSQLQFGVAAGSGDSGGPVFTLTNNFADVMGAGIMSIAQFGVACNVPGLTFCGSRVGFVDINWVLRAQQAEIMITDMVF